VYEDDAMSDDSLKEHIRLANLAGRKKLIFVCHSMGGIVVRKYIVERQLELSENMVGVDLFLIASPSLGSNYANWVSPLARFLGHSQTDALRFSQTNSWLLDLDKEFMNLKEGASINIQGKELVEDTFVVLKRLIRRQVVQPFQGARYFGEPYKVPDSDHFSISKPSDKSAIQHRLLLDFIANHSAPKKSREKMINHGPK
jgi:predicted alpha/beta hydrolase family esterase